MLRCMTVPDAERRNHTIDYFRDLLREVPADAATALDVGCGEGFAARALAAGGLKVTAIDPDEPSLDLARGQDREGITYLEGDVMTADFLATTTSSPHSLCSTTCRLCPRSRGSRACSHPGECCSWWASRRRKCQAIWRETRRRSSPTRRAASRTASGSSRAQPCGRHPRRMRRCGRRRRAFCLAATFRRRLKWRYTLTWIKP